MEMAVNPALLKKSVLLLNRRCPNVFILRELFGEVLVKDDRPDCPNGLP